MALVGRLFLKTLSHFSKFFPNVRSTYPTFDLTIPNIFPNIHLSHYLQALQEIVMSNHSALATTTSSRALELLGAGVSPQQVALALGVDPSLISQYLADEHFANQVAELRYKVLLKHNDRDSAYDGLEDALIKKLKDLIPFMHKPFEIIRALTAVNSAKRRGSSAPESVTAQQTVIQLNLPVQIIQHFQKNSSNQVVSAGNQDLVTVQSARMNILLAASHASAQSSPSPGAKNVVPQP